MSITIVARPKQGAGNDPEVLWLLFTNALYSLMHIVKLLQT